MSLTQSPPLTEDAPSAAITEAEAVRVRQAVTLVENLPITTAAHFILVGLAATVFWNNTDPRLLIGWFLWSGIAAAPGIRHWLRFRNRPPPKTVSHSWTKRAALFSAVSATPWTFAILFLFPTDSAALQVFLVFVVGGVTSGAVASFATFPLVCFSYVLPVSVPIILRLFLVGEHLQIVMAVMILVYVGYLGVYARTAYRAFRAAVRDRAERDRLLGQLEDAQAQLVSAITRIPDQVYLFDEQGRLLFPITRFLDCDLPDPALTVPGCRVEQLFAAVAATGEIMDARNREAEWVAECLAWYRSASGACETRYKDGRYTRVSVSAAAGGGVALICSDITEIKRREAALATSERQAQGVIQTALDAFVRLDGDRKIIEWNPRAEELLGWKRAEVLGRRLEDLILPETERSDFEQTVVNLSSLRKDGPQRARQRLAIHSRANADLQVEMSIAATPGEQEQVINIFLRDLTDVLAAEDRLLRAQKMEAIGQLTGGIAHDFNNLLAVIVGNLELIQERHGGSAELDRLLTPVVHAADRGAELTSRLLAFARRQPLQPVATDLNAAIVDMTEVLRRTLGGAINIELDLDASLGPALIDPGQMDNALINLALNARDALEGSGVLTIATRKQAMAARQGGIFELTSGDYAVLSVTDTGSGMPPDVVQRVFEPFFTTKEVGSGSGLGLSMVHGFVKQSGGDIEIDSQIGQGTTVTLYLPLSASHQATERRTADTTTPVPHGGGEVVLVVEDDSMVLGLTLELLDDLGYRGIGAATGHEGLKVLRSSDPIDLLLTDVMLPGGIRGPDLARQARAQRPGLQVIFMSGYADKTITANSIVPPGTRFIAKPFQKADLARQLCDALSGATTPPR